MGDGGTAVVTARRPQEHRWSARKKADAVVRLLRGESLEALSRELRVEAHRLPMCRSPEPCSRLTGEVSDMSSHVERTAKSWC